MYSVLTGSRRTKHPRERALAWVPLIATRDGPVVSLLIAACYTERTF